MKTMFRVRVHGTAVIAAAAILCAAGQADEPAAAKNLGKGGLAPAIREAPQGAAATQGRAVADDLLARLDPGRPRQQAAKEKKPRS